MELLSTRTKSELTKKILICLFTFFCLFGVMNKTHAQYAELPQLGFGINSMYEFSNQSIDTT